MGATVVSVGRSPAKRAAVASEIKHISGNDAVEALIAYDKATWTRLWDVSDTIVAARATTG